MSLTTKSPRAVALEALAAGEAALPLYSHPCSPKKFTQPQLFACLALKAFFRTDYRGVVAILADCDGLVAALALPCVPHFTTLHKACERLLCFGPAEDLLRATVRRHLGDEPHVELAAADSTGLEAGQVSPYFVRRRAKGQAEGRAGGQKAAGNPHQTTTYTRFPKAELVVDCATHVVLAAVTAVGPRPDTNRLPVLLLCALAHVTVATLLADAGYDWERAHEVAREACGVRSVIPPDSGRPSPNPPAGRYRRLMRRYRDYRYGRRWQAETVMSMIKRRLGPAVAGRTDASRARDVMLKVITHNLMLVVGLLAEVFYRALLTPFHPPVTWIVGADTIPAEVWVEVLDGSSTLDDISFVLSSTDQTAYERPQHPTSGSGERNATGVRISIINYGQDVTGRITDILVGQIVNASVYFKAPPGFEQNATFGWTVPGNTLHDYVLAADGSSAHTIPLGPKHVQALAVGVDVTGTAQQGVRYFWVSTAAAPPNPEVNTVTVTVNNVPGGPFDMNAVFRVFTPSSRANATMGTASLNAAKSAVGLFTAGTGPGITFDATVDMPPGSPQQGRWYFVQKIKRKRDRTLNTPQGAQIQQSRNYGQWGLDQRQPYGDYWNTGDNHTVTDSPRNELGPDDVSSSIDDELAMWVMFQPPGISRPVPLRNVIWRVKATAVKGNGQWGLDGTESQGKGQFLITTEVPTWDLRHDGNDPWESKPGK